MAETKTKKTPPKAKAAELGDALDQTQQRTEGGRSSPLSLPSSNVIAYELEGGHRVTLRPSGTEPLVRVMVEAADEDTAQRLAGGIADRRLDRDLLRPGLHGELAPLLEVPGRLVGQLLQRDLAVRVQPAALDDVARTGVQAGQAITQQLELVGLSRLGSNPLRVLKDNIPGYRLLQVAAR